MRDSASADEYLIGFGDVAGDANLSPSGDLVEAAARCSTCFTRPTHPTKPRIAVAPVPDDGSAPRSTTACGAPPPALGRRRRRSSARAWKLLRSFCSLGGMIARQ